MQPLVSVMLPCYNARDTLAWALTSLLGQTYQRWECIFVDDGSTDDSMQVLNTIRDLRIRSYRFDTNRGRGAARQFALERARGEYLAMLDADDWYYASKLSEQVAAIEEHKALALLGTSVAVVDRHGALSGIRHGQPDSRHMLTLFPPLRRLGSIQVLFAPSLIRMDVARRIGFDPSLIAAEDSDFLLRMLLQHPYGVLSKVTYVYSEHSSASLQKYVRSNALVARVLEKQMRVFPISARIKSYLLPVKNTIYRSFCLAGAEELLIRARSRSATPAEVEEHEHARDALQCSYRQYFSTQPADITSDVRLGPGQSLNTRCPPATQTLCDS